MLFCAPSMKRNFLLLLLTSSFWASSLLRCFPVLPSWLTLTPSASCLAHRTPPKGKPPPSGGGGCGDGPRGRGATTREQACIIKTGQAANQSPGIWFKNLAWGATTDRTLERRVMLLSICLLITLLTSHYSGEVTQKHGRTWAPPQNFFKNSWTFIADCYCWVRIKDPMDWWPALEWFQ